jgi:CheY-like chemotaxis protein
VDTVGDGRSAVDACLRRPYDLVLMDCRLPELDGFAATLEIRRREPSARRTPIVALTASLSPDRQQRCFEAGMGGYLAKPIHTDALDAMLARWLAPDHPPIEPPLPEPDVLDAAGLLDRVDGDLAFVRELLAGLRRDGRRWLADLEDALTRGDCGAVEHAAHALRGATSNLGGVRAAAVAGRLEDDARRGTIHDGLRRVGEIAAELERLLAALDALGAERAAAS